ncbi:MAG TPA: CopD family protein [Alphaproteobacteria bacterium]|jgi:uncharacterized membrane protein|nr:CopD family protein [Alphaproteobacteria bacterium]
MGFWIALHILSAVVWVGGMVFAYAFVRPSAGEALEPAERLKLWRGIFRRFFPVVWTAIALLLLSGYAMVFTVFGGFDHVGLHVHLMQGIGIVMMLIFAHLYFAPWRRLGAALDAGETPAAAKQLDVIRRIVGINTVLGLIVVLLGSTGRYWG